MSLNYLNDTDIIKCGLEYIVHQCNCTSRKSAGLSKQISNQLPYAAPYSHRKYNSKPDKPGTIKIYENNCRLKHTQYTDTPHVVSFYSQYYIGGPKAVYDTSEKRLEWFKNCLVILGEQLKTRNFVDVAFPKNIGCGLAKGNWELYLDAITDFARDNPNITTWIVEL